MKKYISVLLIAIALWSLSVPSVEARREYRYYLNRGDRANIVQPTSLVQSLYSSYPGCGRADIIIGGQSWASCNSVSKSSGSSRDSGWFYAGDMHPSFLSANGSNILYYQDVMNTKGWGSVGPCAEGYRLPNRGDWETLVYYARLNRVSTASLIALPMNNGYRGYIDTTGGVQVDTMGDVLGAYWTNGSDTVGTKSSPLVMHFGSTYLGYRSDGVDVVYERRGYEWQDTGYGLELIAGKSTEIANVRCIRK